MNLTMTTRWHKTTDDRRTYLVVTIATDNNETSDTSASQIYLDIQLPEYSRIRHIGNLPRAGSGNSIGVDVPDLQPGAHQNIVFKVKSRQDQIEPELHLHWIDSASGDLLERHQTGTPMPTEAGEPDQDLIEIVTGARSDHRQARSHREQATTRQRRHRHANRDDIMAGGRELGDRRPRSHGYNGRGHLRRTLDQMMEQVAMLERRIQRLQRMEIEESGVRKLHTPITRTPRSGGSRGGRGCARHGQEHGQRMGRMARRSWRDRHMDA